VLGAGGAAVDPRDPGVIAEAIAVYLDDPDLAAATGAAGRRHASAYTWDATAGQIADLLTEAIA
jgi:glycosyltransferase involved in cell wall biosynthesis